MLRMFQPSVEPAENFNPVEDARALREAMKGCGCNETVLIDIITHRSNKQRQLIQKEYKTHYGRDLIHDVVSETSGNFEKLLKALLTPTIDFYTHEIHAAIAGLGTDEEVLIEFLCGLSNSEIHLMNHEYLHKYGKTLESDIKSDTSGMFKRLLVSLCTGGRDENMPADENAARADAALLFAAGEQKFGTDESAFNTIFSRRSYEQIYLINEEYKRMAGHGLEKAIENEFSGAIKDGLLAIVVCAMDKCEYLAMRLHKSMKGLGTNNDQLIRIIVVRSEIDLLDIKETFEELYGKTLISWIKNDTSGHYRQCLFALIGED